MLRFWRNPEFVRHLRSELRHTRALSVIVLVIILCLLIGLGCWTSTQNSLEHLRRLAAQFDGPWDAMLAKMEQQKVTQFWKLFCRVLIFVQCGILTFWSLLSCAQSISGERERKTWDFQRITRLSATEMLVGKTLGEPVLAYFIVLCCLPITLFVALMGGVNFFQIVSAYALVIASALFVGLAGIWLSSLFESRSRGIGLIGALGLYAFLASAYGFSQSNFPGLGALNPICGLLSLLGYRSEGVCPSFARMFGARVSWPVMSWLLYLTFGAWFVAMIVSNIKRDYDEIRPLSRWQAVACASFVNFTLCLLFYPPRLPKFMSGPIGSTPNAPERIVSTYNFATTMVVINAAVLFAVGLATLTPRERLKSWWRKRLEGRATLLSEDSLPSPWLLISAIAAYGILVLGMFVWRSQLPFDHELLLISAFQSLIICIFVTRDVLFIQWCTLTRLRAPVVKGILYLCLYYAASWVIATVLTIGSDVQSERILDIFTPASVWMTLNPPTGLSVSAMLGAFLQLIVIGVLLRLITARLRFPAAIRGAVAD
jgi:hypothetical protein